MSKHYQLRVTSEYSDILEVDKDEIDSWHVEWEKNND